MAEQLTFDLPGRAALGRGDFFAAPSNAAALALIDGWRDWPQGKLIVQGPEGAGKTHLAHVWAAMTGARIVPAAALSETEIAALAEAGQVVLEDADRGSLDEPALFHLHNLLAAGGGALLITARTPPRDWGLSLPDLQSRMDAAPVARLEPPDEALLAALIVKQFADRQISVSPALVAYLVPRIDRTFRAAADIVDRLDALSLAEGRPVSRALARRLVDIPPEGDA